MKNIYVALGINNSGTIEIKAGSTCQPVERRMKQFYYQSSSCLNESHIVFSSAVQNYCDAEQKMINTVREVAKMWQAKGFSVIVRNENSRRGNPAPHIQDIYSRVVSLLLRKFTEIQKAHVEAWENYKEKIWTDDIDSQIQASLNRIRVLEQAKANRKLIQEKFKLSLTQA